MNSELPEEMHLVFGHNIYMENTNEKFSLGGSSPLCV